MFDINQLFVILNLLTVEDIERICEQGCMGAVIESGKLRGFEWEFGKDAV